MLGNFYKTVNSKVLTHLILFRSRKQMFIICKDLLNQIISLAHNTAY